MFTLLLWNKKTISEIYDVKDRFHKKTMDKSYWNQEIEEI